jgi:hypothetical protein
MQEIDAGPLEGDEQHAERERDEVKGGKAGVFPLRRGA